MERGLGVKNFFSYPNELLIWGYTENLVEIRRMVYEVVKGGISSQILMNY